MRFIATLLVFGLLASTALADGFEDDHAAVRARIVVALEDLGKWCTRSKLPARRADVAAQILAFDPEHRNARRWLKHTRKKGVWQPPSRPYLPKDANDEKLKEYPAERARLVGDVVAALFALPTEHADTVTPGQQEIAYAQTVRLMPANELYRERHGEVRRGDAWILTETESGVEMRETIRAGVKSVLRAMGEPRQVEPAPSVVVPGVSWRHCRATKIMTAHATTSGAEARDLARFVGATPDLLDSAFGFHRAIAAGTHVFALNGARERDTFLRGHPSYDDAKRKIAQQFSSAWVPGLNALVVWNENEKQRLDAAVASMLGALMQEEWELTSAKIPWAGEGISLRLTWELTGTRLSYTRRVSEYGNDVGKWEQYGHLAGADWYALARTRLLATQEDALLDVIYRPVNQFTREDAVMAHAIVAYLIEGRPDAASEFFRRLGGGEASLDLLKEVCGLDLTALRLRMIRWLGERSGR